MNSLNRDGEDLKERLVLDIAAIVRNNYIDRIDALEQAVKIVDNFSKTIIQEAKDEERKRCVEALPKRRIMVNPVPDSDEVIGWNSYHDQATQNINNLDKE